MMQVENRKGDGNSTIHTEIIIGETFVMNQEPERTIVDVTTAYYTSGKLYFYYNGWNGIFWVIILEGYPG